MPTHALRTLRRLLHAARRFEHRAPHYRRLDAERQELRDAITDAELILSVSADGRDQTRRPRAARGVRKASEPPAEDEVA